MAIDPITGLETTDTALGGTTATTLETPTDETALSGTVEIPEVGGGALRDEIKQGYEDAQSGLEDKYQEVSENVPGYEKPSEEALDTISDAGDYRTAEDTVAWQMDQLMNEDNAYMQNAERRAEERAQQYGVLGSSMSVGAAQRAAIESALPIAQQDAETARQFGQQQQQAENQIGVVEAETELGSSLMEQRIALENQQAMLDRSFQLASAQMDQAGQSMLLDLQERWKYTTSDANIRLDAALKEKLSNQQIDASTVASVRQSASEMMQNYQISVESLLKDPEFLKLGSATIRNTLNNMLATTTASVQFLADSSGINLDAYLDDFEDNARFTASV